MSETPFWVRPFDTLFAGPPHSAAAGESSRMRSQFPLPSSTFQGLVRTRLLTGAEPALELSPAHQARIDALVGTPERLPQGWQLEGPFPVAQLAQETSVVQELWLPTPRFLFGGSALDGGTEAPRMAQVLDSFGELQATRDAQPTLNDLNPKADGPLPLYLLGVESPKKAKVKPTGGWISARNLLWALCQQGSWQPEGHGPELPPFVKYEPRPGVAIDPASGVAADQMLFFLETLRFAQGSGLAGVLRAPSLPAPLREQALVSGIGFTGKAARAVAFEPLYALSDDWTRLWRGEHLLPAALAKATELPLESTTELFVWLVLLTPLWLEQPERPTLPSTSSKVRLDVRGALLGDLVTQGGYDRNSRSMRPNRQLVPGGSCWLVRLSGGTLEEKSQVLSKLNAQHPLGSVNDTIFGQGLTVVGLGPQRGRIS